jgi:hypothetical protein
MQSVKVRRKGISAEQAAEAIRDGLGGGYEVQAGGDGTLRVRKGLARAKVSLRGDSGGTVFDISGEGVSVMPLFSATTKMINDRGIARRTAAAIGRAGAFHDNG